MKTGRKMHFGRYSWLSELMPMVDRLSEKYGLHTLDFDPYQKTERKNQYHKEWEQNQGDILKIQKNVPWICIIKSDIDIALSKSRTWSEFLQTLSDMHYGIKDGQHLSLRPEGKERFTRTGRIGEQYTKEALLRRLGEPLAQEQVFGDAEPMLKALREFFDATGKSSMEGIKNSYFQRWYAYSYVNHCKAAYKYRKDLADLGRYTDRCSYLFRHDITTADALSRHHHALSEQLHTIKPRTLSASDLLSL